MPSDNARVCTLACIAGVESWPERQLIEQRHLQHPEHRDCQVTAVPVSDRCLDAVFSCCQLHLPAGGNDEWVARRQPRSLPHQRRPLRRQRWPVPYSRIDMACCRRGIPLRMGSLSQDWLLGAVAIGRSGRDAADLMQQRIDHR